MVQYLNHTDYNRWYRHYILNLTRYANELDTLRIAVDDLPGRERVEVKFEEIDKKIEEIIPRNFDRAALPLQSSELLVENSKVIINLLFRAFGAELPFQGIYQSEKERILKKHQEYRFKEQFKELKANIEAMIEEHQRREKEMQDARRLAETQVQEQGGAALQPQPMQSNVETAQVAPGSNINETIYRSDMPGSTTSPSTSTPPTTPSTNTTPSSKEGPNSSDTPGTSGTSV